MKRGLIGVTTNLDSQVSAIIRYFTNSPWSHTFIVLDESIHNTYVLEANAGGTDIRSWGEYANPAVCPTDLYEPLATPEAIEKALTYTQNKYEGDTYGYFELLAIGVKIILAKLKFRWHDPVEQGAICSQVVWDYLRQLFPNEFSSLSGNSVTPADLYAIVSKSPNFKQA